jgi:general secretion pathway protein K
MTTRSRQRGLALITAMLVVAIVATIAAYLSLGQQVWLRQVQNLVDRSQADNMRHGALDFIGVLLVRKLSLNSKSDHLGEAWTKLPPLPYEGGTIAVTITDAQGLYNLNNLVQNNAPNVHEVAMFKRLLQSLRLDPALAEAVVDWIDTIPATQPGGAEDVEYLASPRPYRAANQPLSSVDELRLVKGFDPEIVETLREYVTALPQATATNVNTAKDKVLEALLNNPALAKTVVATRERTPFDDKADLQPLMQGQPLPQAGYDVKSSFFLVHVDISYGRWQRRSVALIQRQAAGQQSGQASKVLWHQPVYPKLPPDGEDEQT